MPAELEKLQNEALAAIPLADSDQALETLHIEYLGRKGRLRKIMGELASLPADQKPTAGRLANQVKQRIQSALAERKKERARTALTPAAPKLDITVPGTSRKPGTIHPITQANDELVEIFARLGFETVHGPEIEDEYHNFEALNMPPDHPSRDSFDTFYIGGPGEDSGLLLRSHTSPVQARVMETQSPPIRIVVPGKVFRPDTVDASHFPMFHQLEGLYVEEGASFADLKAVLGMAMQATFGGFDQHIRTRFRPSFFPFTEPSAEVDVSCPFCSGGGCSVCGQDGWIEILGAGMVDPEVFRHVGYDPERYTGFAFGVGIDRIAMLKLGISDIRLFYENDARFLAQF